MQKIAYLFKDRVKTFLYLFVFLILVWFCFTNTLRYQEFFSGILLSLILAVWLNRYYLELGFPPFTLKRFVYLLIYTLVLFQEIIKANFDVAYRVLHPKMPIKPGIVLIKTGLKSDIAKLFLANSITLTPGTFTLDILGNNLLIHWIYVRTESIEGATKIIGERFEKYLRIIFE